MPNRRCAMLPPLRAIERGLRLTTEALAMRLASTASNGAPQHWSERDWRLAEAAAAAHGVASLLLPKLQGWHRPEWGRFLADQRGHIEVRHRRIAALLERIDTRARDAGLALVPLKGAALHALGLYAPGERPMADIDLLVRETDFEAATRILQDLGYVHSFDHWRHRAFKPATGEARKGLGEHRDTPINIELHSHIGERLPVACVDITAHIWPRRFRLGLNSYPSLAALMSHLLLHAAGNMCGRTLRLLHLHDIALLAARMTPGDWDAVCAVDAGDAPWWALPPLRLVARYYRDVIPANVFVRLEAICPPLLRAVARRQTLTQLSCSALWLQALPGVEWSRSLGEAAMYVRNRIKPPEDKRRERNDLLRTQLWLRDQAWPRASQRRRIFARLAHRVPRMDTLYVVRAALEA